MGWGWGLPRFPWATASTSAPPGPSKSEPSDGQPPPSDLGPPETWGCLSAVASDENGLPEVSGEDVGGSSQEGAGRSFMELMRHTVAAGTSGAPEFDTNARLLLASAAPVVVMVEHRALGALTLVVQPCQNHYSVAGFSRPLGTNNTSKVGNRGHNFTKTTTAIKVGYKLAVATRTTQYGEMATIRSNSKRAIAVVHLAMTRQFVAWLTEALHQSLATNLSGLELELNERFEASFHPANHTPPLASNLPMYNAGSADGSTASGAASSRSATDGPASAPFSLWDRLPVDATCFDATRCPEAMNALATGGATDGGAVVRAISGDRFATVLKTAQVRCEAMGAPLPDIWRSYVDRAASDFDFACRLSRIVWAWYACQPCHAASRQWEQSRSLDG